MRWVCLLLVGCAIPIEHGLDEEQAAKALLVLTEAGIDAQKALEQGGGEKTYVISVPKEYVSPALRVLRAAGLPQAKRPGLRETFSEASLIPTPMEERARLMDALAGEVVRTLRTVDGVLDARVHVVVSEEGMEPRTNEAVEPRASVLLITAKGKLPLSEESVRKIIVGAVPHLQPQNVGIVFSERELRSFLTPPTSPKLAVGLFVVVIGVLGAALTVYALRAASLRRRLNEKERALS